MHPLRIGYIGCGGLAQKVHIPNLMAATSRCRLTAIAEIRPRLARLVADHWRIPKVYPTHTQLGQDREIDAVVLSGHWSTQGDIAADLLLAGKDVLMEKPMAASVEQAERIVDAERQAQRPAPDDRLHGSALTPATSCSRPPSTAAAPTARWAGCAMCATRASSVTGRRAWTRSASAPTRSIHRPPTTGRHGCRRVAGAATSATSSSTPTTSTSCAGS